MPAWVGPAISAGASLLSGLLGKDSPDESRSNVTRFLSPEQQADLAGLLQSEWTGMLEQDYPVTWDDLRFGLGPALNRIEADAAKARRAQTLRSINSGQGERSKYLQHEQANTDRAELNANRSLLGEGVMQLAMAKPAWRQGVLNAMTNFLAAGSGQQQVSQQVPGYGSILGNAANAFAAAWDDQQRNQGSQQQPAQSQSSGPMHGPTGNPFTFLVPGPGGIPMGTAQATTSNPMPYGPVPLDQSGNYIPPIQRY